MVVPDTPNKRRDYEDDVVKVFYVTNATSVQEFQDAVAVALCELPLPDPEYRGSSCPAARWTQRGRRTRNVAFQLATAQARLLLRPPA